MLVLSKEASHSDEEVRSPIASSATGLVFSRLQVSLKREEGSLSTSSFPKRRSGFTTNAALSFGLELVAVFVSQGAVLLDRWASPDTNMIFPRSQGAVPHRRRRFHRGRALLAHVMALRQNSGTTHGHDFGTAATHALVLNAKHPPLFLPSPCFEDSTISCYTVLLCILRV
jgi:hypothetical protein